MPQICSDSDKPYLFSYGGKTYISPPKQGGKWEVRHENVIVKGRKRNHAVAKKVGDLPRNYIDVPQAAWEMLNKSSIELTRHNGKIRLLADVREAMEEEMESLRKERENLKKAQEEFNTRLAVATSEENTKPVRKKSTRG